MLLYKSAGDVSNSLIMKEKILSFASSSAEAKIAIEEFDK